MIFKKLVKYIKKELDLNREYYNALKQGNNKPGSYELKESAADPSFTGDNHSGTPVPAKTLSSIDKERIKEKQQAVLRNDSKSLDAQNAAYLAMRDKEEERLNRAYDFNTIEGINSIPVPCREVNGGSTTGRVEYYLRGKCFSRHWDAGETELALACLRKAQELMFISDMIWKRADFLRLVVYLYKAGKNEEAEYQLKRIDQFFEHQDIKEDNLSRHFESAKTLKTDLMEVYSYSPYCGECAKYVNRIYSISGRNTHYPSLRQARSECTHKLKCLSFSPFVEGVSEPTFECENIIYYSNRPFVDERNTEERKRYSDWEAMVKQRAEVEARREATMLENAKTERQDMLTLQWLQKNFPSNAPKSLNGFRRMRTMNSTGYQKLKTLAASKGKSI